MDLTNRAISSSFNQEITGSITRILVLGANDDEHSITRLEYGGSNNVDNLVALCRNCHGKKTAIENL